MTTGMNRQILMVSRPKGMPDESNFQMIETPIPTPQAGQVLVRTLYLSVDPYMRGRMNDVKSYVPPYKLNEVIIGGVVGVVVESNHPQYAKGDYVSGYMGFADYSCLHGRYLMKLDPAKAPLTTALYVLGMPGLTAYFGLLDIGNPQAGETVLVSGAAGAVGTLVGQIAKLQGCRVVGVAGSEEKINYLLHELNFDAAINYKTTENMKKALQEACPQGIDVYFDNVGGETTDAAMKLLNRQARIVLCGQIAQYNLERVETGPRLLSQLIVTSSMIKGFTVGDYQDRFPEGIKQLGEWLAQGKLKYRENIVYGLENTVQAFLGLFRGENLGKQLVQVADVQQVQ